MHWLREKNAIRSYVLFIERAGRKKHFHSVAKKILNGENSFSFFANNSMKKRYREVSSAVAAAAAAAALTKELTLVHQFPC